MDVDERTGKIGVQFVNELHAQLSFQDVAGPQSETELLLWLDRAIQHPGITQMEALVWLRQVVSDLVEQRRIPLPELVANRFRLRDAVALKLDEAKTEAFTRSYQRLLSPDAARRLEASPELCFEFPLNQYPAPTIYQGPIKFPKHYYELPAMMNSEEAQCAAFLDGSDFVRTWVRNLVRCEGYAFWLPTSTDRFWPDFVAKLSDDRILVVEYKSERDWELPDSREKRQIGHLWASLSYGRCLFVMPKGQDWNAISAVVGATSF